jgi:hypothetical protein
LTENLSGGELPLVLWHWHVGLLSPPQKKRKKKKIGSKNKLGLVVAMKKWIGEENSFRD